MPSAQTHSSSASGKCSASLNTPELPCRIRTPAFSAKPRTVNAAFPFSMNPQRHIEERPLAMDVNHAGGGRQPAPGRSEITTPSPLSRKGQCIRVAAAAAAAAAVAAGVSGPGKRRLGDAGMDRQQGGPATKRRQNRETRVSGIAAAAAAALANSRRNSNNMNHSPTPLLAFTTSSLQVPQHRQHHQHHQHHYQWIPAPVQKTIAPCQEAISESGGHNDVLWGKRLEEELPATTLSADTTVNEIKNNYSGVQGNSRVLH